MSLFDTLRWLSGIPTTNLSEFWAVGGGTDPSVPNMPLGFDAVVIPYTDNNLIKFVGYKMVAVAGATSGDTVVDLSSGLLGGLDDHVSPGDFVTAVYATGSTANRTLSITDGTTDYELIDSERYSDDTYDTNLRVAYKIMGATPDASVTFGPTGGAADAGIVAVYVRRGVDPLDPIMSESGGTSTNDANPNGYDFTSLLPGAGLVLIGAGASATATPYNDNPDLENFYSLTSSDTNDVTLGIGFKSSFAGDAGDGVSSIDAWTGAPETGAESSALIHVILRPASMVAYLSYSWTQSSTYSGLTGGASGAGMANGTNASAGSVWASANWSGTQYIRVDLGVARPVYGARIACINDDPAITGGPWGASYTNGANLQYSDNGSDWTTAVALSGFVDDGPEFLNWELDGSAHRYWRISKAGWLGVGDFILYGPYANITVANAAHGHTASSPTIGSKASITINSATHGHSASQPAITSHLAVTPNSANHAHSASNVTVASKASVSASGASHAHAATSPTIAPKATIATASANHGLTSTTLTITSKASITVSGAAHAHSASSPAISPKASIAAASAHHNLASTSPTITSKAAVVVSAAAHAHSASSPAISPKASLVVASAVHAVASTNPTLSFKSTISINGAVSAHIATSPAISPKASVTVGSSSHGLSSTSPAITPKASLTVAGATHAHSVTSPAVVSRASLTVSAAQHGHTATQPSLTAKNAVTVTSAVHAHSATSPSIVPKATISVGNANHALSSTNPTITPRATLAIAAAHHAVASTGPSITPSLVLPVQSASHAHSASSPTVIPKASITVGSALHSLSSTSPGITSKATLSISAAHHALSSIGPTITPRAVLTIAAASHAHSATSPGVAFAALLAVNDNTHGHICTSPALALTYSLAPADAYHLHIAESPAVRLFVSPSERRNVHTSYLSRNEATVITSRDGVAFNWPRNRATALGSRIAAFPARSRIR